MRELRGRGREDLVDVNVVGSGVAGHGMQPPFEGRLARAVVPLGEVRIYTYDDTANGGGSAVGGTTPRAGLRTASAASTFWSSRTLPGQS